MKNKYFLENQVPKSTTLLVAFLFIFSFASIAQTENPVESAKKISSVGENTGGALDVKPANYSAEEAVKPEGKAILRDPAHLQDNIDPATKSEEKALTPDPLPVNSSENKVLNSETQGSGNSEVLPLLSVTMKEYNAAVQQDISNHKANVVSPEIEALQVANISNDKKHYDNGYIKFILSGDIQQDAETYRSRKERLRISNPELYMKLIADAKKDRFLETDSFPIPSNNVAK